MRADTNESTGAPGVTETTRIVAIANAVIRNLEITQCYSRLAAAFAQRSGDGANWCTYATWASRQAGRTIRGEDLLDQLSRRLGQSRWLLHPISTLWRRLLRYGLFQKETRIGRLTTELHTPFDAFERASDAVARGNLKVFEEIGDQFARYLHACPPEAAAGSPAFQRFLDQLRPGDPPGGQRHLQQAFAHYERRRLERDPKKRAQLLVLANLEIALHEQTRLQPEIQTALDASLSTQEELGRRALEALFPSAADWSSIIKRPAVTGAGILAAGAQRAASKLAREIITESFMVLSLPGRVLALGKHLPDTYPDTLRQSTDAELIQLLKSYEPAPPAADNCGVRDWADIHQRMHYIVHLFCAFQLNEELSRPPFTQKQVSTFSRGVVPDGDL